MDFVFVTGSANKVREAEEILSRAVDTLPLDLPEVQARSSEEVARHKAREAFARLDRPCVVEDTGLEFAALGTMPGPFIKWFEREAGLEAICRMLDGLADRRAAAVCVLALTSGEEEIVATGRLEGHIAPNPRGDGGFGWDSIFIPEGKVETFAQMRREEKHAISHRRLAWEELSRLLRQREGSRPR